MWNYHCIHSCSHFLHVQNFYKIYLYRVVYVINSQHLKQDSPQQPARYWKICIPSSCSAQEIGSSRIRKTKDAVAAQALSLTLKWKIAGVTLHSEAKEINVQGNESKRCTWYYRLEHLENSRIPGKFQNPLFLFFSISSGVQTYCWTSQVSRELMQAYSRKYPDLSTRG